MAKKTRKAKRAPVRRKRARSVREPGAGGKTVVHLPLPANATPEEIADAQHYLDTLAAAGQIARGRGPLPPGATHRIAVGPRGKKRLVRKRFSAT